MTTLRLRMGEAERRGRDRLDGGWWPHSRDLPTELAGLVDDFPAEHGRIARATYSPADWDNAPRRITVHGGQVKVGPLFSDDTHVVYLATADRVVYCLLVVPPGFDRSQGEEALLAAATPGNRHAAHELLEVVANELPVDPSGEWLIADGD